MESVSDSSAGILGSVGLLERGLTYVDTVLGRRVHWEAGGR